MTNFDIFAANPQFEPFASVAVSAERILHIDPSACVLNCRRAMEFAVKWMYSVDKALVMPYQDSLVSLMNTEDFRDIVGADIWRRMDLIRRMGNNAAHTGKKITEEQAALCLENLYILLDFVAYCYGENYTEGHRSTPENRFFLSAGAGADAFYCSLSHYYSRLHSYSQGRKSRVFKKRQNPQGEDRVFLDSLTNRLYN